MKEVKRTKKEFNARARELTQKGYRKIREFCNYQTFLKHVCMGNDLEVVLVKGWKK